MQKKNIITILGLGRSGTSVIARSLKLLQIDLGNNLIPADEHWNPKGFWGDYEAYLINEKILHTFNFKWDSLGFNEMNISPDDSLLCEINQSTRTLLQKRLSETDYWAFKDQRM